MAKRKSISARTRFEIFKRDAFTCQYCGATPPSVILHIDHIVPVASGGGNEDLNLITACDKCNQGKSDKGLETVIPSTQEQIQQQRERVEQVKAYNEFLVEMRELELEQVELLGLYWHNKFKAEKDKWVFGVSRAESVRQFLKHLPFVIIKDAIDTAHAKIPVGPYDESVTFRYFCGVCWNTIKGVR